MLTSLYVCAVCLCSGPITHWQVPTSALEDGDLAHDIAMVADMNYPGGFGFTVSTSLSINWPMAGAARLPLAVDIELVELVGPVRIGVRRQQSYCSFLTEPHVRFKVCIA